MSNLRTNIRIAVVIAAAILLIIFLLQNMEDIPVEFLFFEGKMPGIVLILVTTLAGFVVGYFMAATRQRKSKAEPKKEETPAAE